MSEAISIYIYTFFALIIHVTLAPRGVFFYEGKKKIQKEPKVQQLQLLMAATKLMVDLLSFQQAYILKADQTCLKQPASGCNDFTSPRP